VSRRSRCGRRARANAARCGTRSAANDGIEIHLGSRNQVSGKTIRFDIQYGLGETNGSFCTPRGRHIVRAKIGAGQPLGAVFVRRRPTGEIWTPELHAKYPGRDWMLTRILWLSVASRRIAWGRWTRCAADLSRRAGQRGGHAVDGCVRMPAAV
jgi:hypothetical protein